MDGQTIKKAGPHYAWAILAAALLINAFGMGLMMNCRGVLFSAIIADLGFRSGDLSIYYTICSLAAAFSITTVTRLYLRKNPKAVIALMLTFVCGTTGAMALFSHLWQWYISAVINGIGSSSIMMLMGITLNNWFRKYNGTVVGISMASTGVVGALFNPICSRLIQALGWRPTVALLAAIGYTLSMASCLVLLRRSPEECGMRPFGETGGPTMVSAAGVKERAVPTRIFVMSVAALVLFMFVSPINNQLATYARGLGYSITVGATITSCSMLGNVVGKLGLGALTDRFGIYRAVNIIQAIVMASLVLFLFGTGSQLLLCLAAFLYGPIFSVSTTMPPLLFLDLYGGNYKEKVSRMSMCNGLVVAMLSSALPYIYDYTGSYSPVFVTGIVTSLISIVLFNIVRAYSAKQKKAEAGRPVQG